MDRVFTSFEFQVPPEMAMAGNVGDGDMEKQLKKLKYSRRGKKSAITKRVQQINKLVSEVGSRRRIQILLDALLKVFAELREVCSDISSMCDDEYNDIEDIRTEVDDCMAMVVDYLEARRDDPPSTDSITESWVLEGVPGYYAESSGGSSQGDEHRSGGSDRSVMESEEVRIKEVADESQVSSTFTHPRPATPRILPKIPVSNTLVLGGDVSGANQLLGICTGDQIGRDRQADSGSAEVPLDEVAGKMSEFNTGLTFPLGTSFTGDGVVRRRDTGKGIVAEKEIGDAGDTCNTDSVQRIEDSGDGIGSPAFAAMKLEGMMNGTTEMGGMSERGGHDAMSRNGGSIIRVQPSSSKQLAPGLLI